MRTLLLSIMCIPLLTACTTRTIGGVPVSEIPPGERINAAARAANVATGQPLTKRGINRSYVTCDAVIEVVDATSLRGQVRVIGTERVAGTVVEKYSTGWRTISPDGSVEFTNVRLSSVLEYKVQHRNFLIGRPGPLKSRALSARSCRYADNASVRDKFLYEASTFGIRLRAQGRRG